MFFLSAGADWDEERVWDNGETMMVDDCTLVFIKQKTTWHELAIGNGRLMSIWITNISNYQQAVTRTINLQIQVTDWF